MAIRAPLIAGAALAAADGAPKYVFKNECGFDVFLKTEIAGKVSDLAIVPAGQESDQSLTSAGRVYWGPSDWDFANDNPASLGFLEYSLDGHWADLSMLDFVGLPAQLVCAQADGNPNGYDLQPKGCGADAGDQYGGYAAMQAAIKDHCPTAPTQIKGAAAGVWSCPSPGLLAPDALKTAPIMSTWDVAGTWPSPPPAGATCALPADLVEAAQDIDRCNPTECFFDTDAKGQLCAAINRGHDGVDPKTFYPGYDMTAKKASYKFNPFAAFAHTICGTYGGYAFPTDEHPKTVPHSFAALLQCSGTYTVTLCPAAHAAQSNLRRA